MCQPKMQRSVNVLQEIQIKWVAFILPFLGLVLGMFLNKHTRSIIIRILEIRIVWWVGRCV